MLLLSAFLSVFPQLKKLEVIFLIKTFPLWQIAFTLICLRRAVADPVVLFEGPLDSLKLSPFGVWFEIREMRVKAMVPSTESRVAQRKRAGPITQRSMDRNHPLLMFRAFYQAVSILCQHRHGFKQTCLKRGFTPLCCCSGHLKYVGSSCCRALTLPFFIGKDLTDL